MSTSGKTDLKTLDNDESLARRAYLAAEFGDGPILPVSPIPLTPREEWLAAAYYRLGYGKAIAQREREQ